MMDKAETFILRLALSRFFQASFALAWIVLTLVGFILGWWHMEHPSDNWWLLVILLIVLRRD